MRQLSQIKTEFTNQLITHHAKTDGNTLLYSRLFLQLIKIMKRIYFTRLMYGFEIGFFGWILEFKNK